MASEVKLVDMIDTINGMNDVDSVKSYCLSIISTLQKELQKTKSKVEDFRNSYGLDNYDSKSGVMNLYVDPVLNAEVLHLKKQLNKSNDEVKILKDLLDMKEFTSESALGKHLIEKVRLLKLENNELSKLILKSHAQPLCLELNREKELNKVLDKKLNSLHQLNTQLKKENNLLSQKVSELSSDSSKSKRDSESSSRKGDRYREHSSSYSRSDTRGRRSLSPRKRSSSSRKSPSPKRKDRNTRSSPYSRQSDKQNSNRSSNREPSRDRNKNHPPRSRH